ncbi:hypothetical protein [Salibacterium qingdaonense]|uniref:hypothetical protein n=1 Tax=Salibacterium qingdaonense TaxID=266892 RepID=UPI001160BC2D|nr:hypothetical protein [Salibacterium qingdaonense]
MKYKVNHREKRIPIDDDFLTIKPGQHLTSVRKIAEETGWYERATWKEANPKTISKILEWLEKQEMISISRGKSNRQYTLITLINWGSYQVKENEGNSEGTSKEQSLDINKNELECIKNDGTTAADARVSEEASDGTPETDPQGNPEQNSGEISQTSYVQAVLDKFITLRGSGFMTSSKDDMAAEEIFNQGVELNDALAWMEEKFQQYHATQSKHSRSNIQTLEYCVGYILDKHHEKQQPKEAAAYGPSANQYAGGYGQAKGTGGASQERTIMAGQVGRHRPGKRA